MSTIFGLCSDYKKDDVWKLSTSNMSLTAKHPKSWVSFSRNCDSISPVCGSKSLKKRSIAIAWKFKLLVQVHVYTSNPTAHGFIHSTAKLRKNDEKTMRSEGSDLCSERNLTCCGKIKDSNSKTYRDACTPVDCSTNATGLKCKKSESVNCDHRLLQVPHLSTKQNVHAFILIMSIFCNHAHFSWTLEPEHQKLFGRSWQKTHQWTAGSFISPSMLLCHQKPKRIQSVRVGT